MGMFGTFAMHRFALPVTDTRLIGTQDLAFPGNLTTTNKDLTMPRSQV
jgi:hypothetical protein